MSRAPRVVGKGWQVGPQDLRHFPSAGADSEVGGRRAALHPFLVHVPDLRDRRPAGGGQAVEQALSPLPEEGRGRVLPAAQVQRVLQQGKERRELEREQYINTPYILRTYAYIYREIEIEREIYITLA